jgi:hypothetical protein
MWDLNLSQFATAIKNNPAAIGNTNYYVDYNS